MKNAMFEVLVDSKTGYITSIKNPSDPYEMNWCLPMGKWGQLTSRHTIFKNFMRFQEEVMPLTRLDIREDLVTAEYSDGRLLVRVERYFSETGNFVEEYRIKNITNTVVTLNRDNFGIALPFSDRYTSAEECMKQYCNTHIWCGKDVTWVNALRMGESECNLGLFLTNGSVVSYSQKRLEQMGRGVFIFESETVLLKAGEEYLLRWELFWHKGKEDFWKKLSEFDRYIDIKAKHYTIFEGEKIEFAVTSALKEKPVVTCCGEEITVNEKDGAYLVEYVPAHTGEYRFQVQAGETVTYAEFLVKPNFKDFLTKRVHFIVDHQQCKDPESPLYGAYLIYDNVTDSMYFDDETADHNASRERLNMPIVLARYLQEKDDEKVRASLDLYMEFLKREFYDVETGEVYNTIGKRRDMIRLYNAPGVMLLFCEMYMLTKDDWYLDHIVKLADNYYGIGGKKCYANGLAIARVMKIFKESGRKADTEKMLAYFREHVNVMINNGTAYPKHEVNYEQTIVTPAVTCISEFGLLSEDKEYYLEEVQKHLECLARFSGFQPSFHLNEIAIRFWDDFWFGKSGYYGDTFPHHLSSLTARAYVAYYRLSGDKKWVDAAEECLRNCMCLVSDDGRGAAAYVYPHMSDGKKGEFYDEWANDQDVFFYHALNCSDVIETFKI